MSFGARVAALLGKSAFSRPPIPGVPTLQDRSVERVRSGLGGQLLAPPVTQLEWFLEDVDKASYAADAGDMAPASRLTRAMKRDPVIAGLQATKNGGVCRLPKKWHGDPDMIEALTGRDGAETLFDQMCPPGELKAMSDDADFLCVAVGELVPVEGRSYPVLERKDPEYLYYLWSQNQWYLRTLEGMLPINPGDGRWVMLFSGPRLFPWQGGLWHALGRAWVRKDSNAHLKDNWAFHLANAARVAVSPAGATQAQEQHWFQQVMAWGLNSVFGMKPGYDVKLLESNGRGWEGFDSSIEQSNKDFMIALAGQLVTVTGGTGFSSEDLYQSIRFDLIEATARPLAYTISTQILPAFAYDHFGGESALERCPSFHYSVRKPRDLVAISTAWNALASALNGLQNVTKQGGRVLDIVDALETFGLRSAEAPNVSNDAPQLVLGVDATAAVVTGAEARAAQGLLPFGDERDAMTIADLLGDTGTLDAGEGDAESDAEDFESGDDEAAA